MYVDIHCHYASPDFPEQARPYLGAAAPAILREPDGTEVLMRYGRRVPFLRGELTRLTSHLDRAPLLEGCIQVLAPPTFFFFYNEPAEVAAPLCALLNDGLSEAVRLHPNRMAGMAAVPMQDARYAIAELERTHANLNMRAVCIGSNVNGRGLDSAEFWPFYEVAEALGVPIFIHPMSSDLAGADRMREYFLHNLIGNPLDTTLAAARLIFGGVLEAFPELQVCLAHGGGYLAWASGRMARGYTVRPECRHSLRQSPHELMNRFYVDTIVHSPQALEYLIACFGADRVLCGSDYPFQIGDPSPTELVEGHPHLTDEDRQRILRENATKLFRLEPRDLQS